MTDKGHYYALTGEGGMAARDFINETLLPWLEREIASQADGNKHYIRGVEDTMKALQRFVESHRDAWDVPE